MQETNFELIQRVEPLDWVGAGVLLFALVLILWTKWLRPNAFITTFNLFRTQLNFDSTIKESWDLNGPQSWLLNANFVLNFGLSIYLMLKSGTVRNFEPSYAFLGFAMAFAFFVLAFVSMTCIGAITGAGKVFRRPMQLAWVLPQFVGLFFFVLNLVWILNPDFSQSLVQVLIASLLILSAQRFLRSISYLLGSGIEWYYILLYLCTLEIIPLLLLVWFFFDWK